jgi:hypothetical protein
MAIWVTVNVGGCREPWDGMGAAGLSAGYRGVRGRWRVADRMTVEREFAAAGWADSDERVVRIAGKARAIGHEADDTEVTERDETITRLR